MDKKIKIVTHSGHFHTDEIFAVAVLRMVLGKENIEILRSREKEVIENGDYVVDVGGVYDVMVNKFDHHQKGGAGKRENSIPYASFGLVWKKYGERLCGNREVADRIDIKLVQPIDAGDNGMQIMSSSVVGVFTYDIGDFFDASWPTWKEGEGEADAIFMNLLDIAEKLLQREIIRNVHKLEAREFVLSAYSNAVDKRLVIFDGSYPGAEFIAQFPEPIFIVLPKASDGTWLLVTVRDDQNSYINRKDLPRSWGGKRDEELEKETGVTGATFCHRALFLAGAKTKEAILKMAEIALNS